MPPGDNAGNQVLAWLGDNLKSDIWENGIEEEYYIMFIIVYWGGVFLEGLLLFYLGLSPRV